MKRCIKCKQEKEESEFHKNRSRKDGLAYYCKECKNARQREYSKKYKPWLKRYEKCKRDPALLKRMRGYGRKQREKIKRGVYDHYGRVCVACGYDDERALTIDHINNDGAQHKKERSKSMHSWLRDNSYPPEYQTLCRNCNWIKQVEHKRKMREKVG